MLLTLVGTISKLTFKGCEICFMKKSKYTVAKFDNAFEGIRMKLEFLLIDLDEIIPIHSLKLTKLLYFGSN